MKLAGRALGFVYLRKSALVSFRHSYVNEVRWWSFHKVATKRRAIAGDSKSSHVWIKRKEPTCLDLQGIDNPYLGKDKASIENVVLFFTAACDSEMKYAGDFIDIRQERGVDKAFSIQTPIAQAWGFHTVQTSNLTSGFWSESNLLIWMNSPLARLSCQLFLPRGLLETALGWVGF